MKMTQESAKKQAILEAAQRLMLEKGYVATTVDEICTQAEVTKGSFFYYFKNKEDLGKVLVRRFSEHHQAMIESELDGIPDPLDRIFCYLDVMIQMSQKCCAKGCLVGTFIQELHESHPDIKDTCSTSFQMYAQFLHNELKAAQEKYTPQTSYDIQGLAEAFLAMTQGAMILIKAHKDCHIMARTLTHYKRYLESIFKR